MANNDHFLRVALPTPLRRLFDYLPPQGVDPTELIAGVRVKVPFQSRTLIGIVIDIIQASSVPYAKIKRAEAILDEKALLSDEMFSLCQFAADYYHYSLGEALICALPGLLRKGKPPQIKNKLVGKAVEQVDAPILNEAQKQAVKIINECEQAFRVFLLDGITGSGKTEVYLQTIAQQLTQQRQVLVLVPEISLTPQTINRFCKRFAVPIATLHSGLSERKRLDAWLGASEGDIKIVIGTRSAIFTPFANLGLIIVDEEHDTSFKQQERFRYHARDLSIMRANKLNIPIVLGSATPSLESLLNVKRGRYVYLSLPERAGNALLPQYQLLDVRKSKLEEGLSADLLQAMQQHLDAGNQVMLFLNRRGFAPVIYCVSCAYVMPCKRCDAKLVYHRLAARLQCHHCDAYMKVPLKCPACQEKTLQPVGFGTERLEETLIERFPGIPIIRIDRDSTMRKGAMQNLLAQIQNEKKAILLGTQMLAKGHHFPQVTLVGVIDADSGLFSADFRASEQMGQLLVQVSGRAGREEKPGAVIIQTRHPTHPMLQTLIKDGYGSFAQTLLNERERTGLPPYTHFAVFRAEAYAEESVNRFLTMIKEKLIKIDSSILLFGPVKPVMARRKGLHCRHLLIKAEKRSHLQLFLKQILKQMDNDAVKNTVKWVLDVDPIEV